MNGYWEYELSFSLTWFCVTSGVIWIELNVFQNPDYMKDAFYIKIETMHFPDRGTQENVCTQPEYSHKSMVLETMYVHNQIITIRLKSIVLETLYIQAFKCPYISYKIPIF